MDSTFCTKRLGLEKMVAECIASLNDRTFAAFKFVVRSGRDARRAYRMSRRGLDAIRRRLHSLQERLANHRNAHGC